MEFERIPKEKFEFAQMDKDIHDKKLETKTRSFFADAMIRFKKNESSVIAAWILLFLVIFAFISPILSPIEYTLKDKRFINSPPFIREIHIFLNMQGIKIHF